MEDGLPSLTLVSSLSSFISVPEIPPTHNRPDKFPNNIEPETGTKVKLLKALAEYLLHLVNGATLLTVSLRSLSLSISLFPVFFFLSLLL